MDRAHQTVKVVNLGRISVELHKSALILIELIQFVLKKWSKQSQVDLEGGREVTHLARVALGYDPWRVINAAGGIAGSWVINAEGDCYSGHPTSRTRRRKENRLLVCMIYVIFDSGKIYSQNFNRV